jgi:hypothetical protein
MSELLLLQRVVILAKYRRLPMILLEMFLFQADLKLGIDYLVKLGNNQL